ncbi:GntR family transcriptional regulator [Mycobacterium sp.]|uniref:GntR family transcriptional regulator n=1 Tax=Mycobacterium sp. TaxID=1785 RepID=UPI003F9C00F6
MSADPVNPVTVAERAERRPATEQVHDLLRQQIIDGDLAAGAKISQLQLSRRLSVGRTPLREALKLLEREGLVISNGLHRSVQISPLSMVDLDDLYSLRVTGESLAIWSTVPALRDDDFAMLERHLAVMTDPADLPAAEEAHRAFHAGLRIGTGQRMQNHLEMLFQHAERYIRAFARDDPELIEKKHQEHRNILAACRRRDRNGARSLLIDHVASTAIALMQAERHAPFSLPLAVRMAKVGAGK